MFSVSLGKQSNPKRKQKQCLAKFGGTNKEYYGIFRSGLFQLKQTTEKIEQQTPILDFIEPLKG